MARRSKKRSPYRPGTKDRQKRPHGRPPIQSSAEYRRRFEGSKFAAQIIEAMIDNIEGAIKCVKRELKGIFRVDHTPVPRRGRIHVFLRPLDGWRKHAHFIIKVGEKNTLASVTHWGRAWA